MAPPDTGLLMDDEAILVRKTEPGAQAYTGSAARYKPLTHVVRHSPDGFNFGYLGSGPADLALSILTAVAGPAVADRHYQQFKAQFVALQTKPVWGITVREVKRWLALSEAHAWQTATIEKGRDANIKLPVRCSKCGAIKRPDGKDGPCRDSVNPVGPSAENNYGQIED
jgi:hypothetical protein